MATKKFKDDSNNLLGHGAGAGMKINDAAGNGNTGIQKETAKDDSWKEQLRSAYDTSARRQIEASDRSYDQAISNADRQALSRGMQRSSYNNATLAKLDSDKTKAQNDIRENTEAAYNQAVLQQQNVQDQLDFQREQAAQSQSNWQAQFDAGRQDAAQSQANWQAQFENTQQQQAQQQANWQAQFENTQQQQAQSQANWEQQFGYQQQQDQQAQANWQAQFDNTVQQQQQAQTNWQTQFDNTVQQQQQAQSNWEQEFGLQQQQAQASIAYTNAQTAATNAATAAAQAAASGSSGSSSSGYWDTRKPWERLGISEEEYNRLYGNNSNGTNNNGLFGNTGNSWWQNVANGVAAAYNAANS